MLQVSALNICSPRLGHWMAETLGATIKPKTVSEMKWSPVLQTQCQHKYAYNFSPLFSNHLRLNKRLLEYLIQTHWMCYITKLLLWRGIFSTIPLWSCPHSLNTHPLNSQLFDSGFPQLRWSKNVSSEYRNNPCSAKQASESENFKCSSPSQHLTLRDSIDCSLARLLYPWNSPGKNIGVGCHSLLQGIFPTQGLNPRISSIAGRLYTVCENHLFWSPFILPSLFDLRSLTSTLTLLLHPYLSHSISHQALCILRKGILNWFLSFPFSLSQQFPQCWQWIKFTLQPQTTSQKLFPTRYRSEPTTILNHLRTPFLPSTSGSFYLKYL